MKLVLHIHFLWNNNRTEYHLLLRIQYYLLTDPANHLLTSGLQFELNQSRYV